MSSCKCFTERTRRSGFQTQSEPQRRKMAPLLRLDSTGEIASTNVFNSGQKPNCTEKSNCKNQLSIKSFFDGFNMNSVLDSANAYIGTATSYFGGICNQKTKQSLTRSDSDTTFFEYFRKFSPKAEMGKRHFGSLDSNSFINLSSANINNSGFPSNDNMQSKCTDTSVPMSSSIFGILQNTLVNSVCTPEKSKPGPYIPPPLKKKMMEEATKGVRIDPRLTPYNARLLERSKIQRTSKGDHENQHCVRPVFVQNRVGNSRKKMRSPPPAFLADNSLQTSVQTKTEVPRTCDKTEPQDNCVSSSGENPEVNDRVSDWFEYENHSADIIPIYFDVSCKLQTAVAKKDVKSNGYTKMCDTKANSPSLHSWLSVDVDLDVQKATEESLSSSLEKGMSQQTCDKLEPASIPQQIKESFSNGAVDKSAKNEDHTDSQSDNVFPQILYLRNIQNGRKCRPSSKKRRRQKPQPNDINKSTEKGNTTCPSSSVAIILGLDKEDRQCHPQSFLMTCDTDSSSDWSDSDLEVDSVDEVLQTEFCPLSNPFNLFNLEVMCSVQPTTPSPCSSLDAVNLSWQLNISVDSDKKAKKKQANSVSKKVQFADDQDLETVHHMVAWSYAYATARKGPWEEYARDRGRFQRRIADAEKTIGPILSNKHREKIYTARFNVKS